MKRLDWLVMVAAIVAVSLVAGVVGLRAEPKAQPIRLIGMCNGQLLGAMEEDHFPAPCEWIEGVRIEERNFDE